MEHAHVAVLLEEVRGQFKVFGESLHVTNEKLDRLSSDMGDVKERLAGVENGLTNVEGRLTNVEGRLGHVEGRLTNMAQALNGAPPRKKSKK